MAIPASQGAEIRAWEDDPGSDVATTCAVPDLTKTPLAFVIERVEPPPADVYSPGTPQFRYWTAAEALRRAADFWAPLLRRRSVDGGRDEDFSWRDGRETLSVFLDEGVDLNAYYARRDPDNDASADKRDALFFFHGPAADGTVWAGESPDIVCHELGHAILDSIRPDLWDATSHEAAAFHEAFGDISAILSALQLPSVRTAVRDDTGGKLYRNSRLSRLGEQIGAAVRLFHPDAVEPDCLRNAVNSFTYVDPITLPQMAPSSMLSSEPHSFSRIFTDAFFEILAGIVTEKLSKKEEAPSFDQALRDASVDSARILIDGIVAAPLVPNFYSQVAAAMVNASAVIATSYPAILKAAFVRRSILSLQTAAQGADQHKAQFASMFDAALKSADARSEPLSFPSGHYGLKQRLLVHPAAHPRALSADVADAVMGSDEHSRPPAEETAVFVDNLFRLGRVESPRDVRVPGQGLERGNRASSHKLVEEQDGLHLRRCRFACGMAH